MWDFRCKRNDKTEKQDEEISAGNDDFNDLAIQVIGDRISQEFDNIAGAETKASILVGTCVALFAIFSLTNNSLNLTNFLTKSTDNQIIIIILWASLALSFFMALAVVFPANKTKTITPRKYNNNLAAKKISEAKEIVKSNLIENFEYIHTHRLRDVKCLKWGYVLLIIGFLAMLIGMIFYQ